MTIEVTDEMRAKAVDDIAAKPVSAIFPTALEAARKGVCPLCKKEVKSLRDALSLKEFYISGMCQSCQDKTFMNPEVEG